jgi:alkylation response protein AidB-like acyl-CoA dehydrogenase
MKMNFRPELETFRAEVRAFLDDSLTPDLKKAAELCAGVYADQPAAVEWLRILNKKGGAVAHWPVEYGGCVWALDQHYIFQRDLHWPPRHQSHRTPHLWSGL